MLARWAKRVVDLRPVLLTVAVGLAVGGLAIALQSPPGEPVNAVLFSGEEAFGSLFGSESKLALSSLALLILIKGLARSISLGNFAVGRRFPRSSSASSRA